MPTVGTLENLLGQCIKRSGKKVDDIVEMTGVSRSTFYRHITGKTKNGFTDKDCMVSLVEEGIAPKESLVVYCCEKCQIGEARQRLRCKKIGPALTRTIV